MRFFEQDRTTITITITTKPKITIARIVVVVVAESGVVGIVAAVVLVLDGDVRFEHIDPEEL